MLPLKKLTFEARLIWVLPCVANLARALVFVKFYRLALGVGTARLLSQDPTGVQALIVAADALAVAVSVLGAVGAVD